MYRFEDRKKDYSQEELNFYRAESNWLIENNDSLQKLEESCLKIRKLKWLKKKLRKLEVRYMLSGGHLHQDQVDKMILENEFLKSIMAEDKINNKKITKNRDNISNYLDLVYYNLKSSIGIRDDEAQQALGYAKNGNRSAIQRNLGYIRLLVYNPKLMNLIASSNALTLRLLEFYRRKEKESNAIIATCDINFNTNILLVIGSPRYQELYKAKLMSRGLLKVKSKKGVIPALKLKLTSLRKK